jgi:transcriptional regulator with XRE-family HTH domain
VIYLYLRKKGIGMDDLIIGEKLRQWRKQAGLSQTALEEKAGLGHNTVSRIERGEKNPNIATLTKLAGALKISYEQLMMGTPSEKGRSEEENPYKKRLLYEIDKLTESECKEVYPVWERLVGLAKKQKED